MVVQDRVAPGADQRCVSAQLGPTVAARLVVVGRGFRAARCVQGVGGERGEHVELTHNLAQLVKRRHVLAYLGQQLLYDPDDRVQSIPMLLAASSHRSDLELLLA